MKAYTVLNKPILNKVQNELLDKVECTLWNICTAEEISEITISNSCLYFSLFPILLPLLAPLDTSVRSVWNQNQSLAQLQYPRGLHVYVRVGTRCHTVDC